MKVEEKTKEQRVQELAEMRQRIAELEAVDTELKHTAKALLESEEQHWLLVETIPHGIEDIDTSGRILFANDALHKIYGYDEGELVGKSILDLVATASEQKELREYLKLLMREQPPPVDYFGKKRTEDGKIIDVQVAWNYKRDSQGQLMGFTSVITDITEQKQTEEALRESEERFRFVTESAIDAIISADGSGNIISWNKGALTIFGYEEDEVLGKPLTFLMPQRYKEPHRRGLERISSTGEARVIGKTVELHGLRKDGTEFPLELSLSTWRKGESQFYSGIIRDITERKQAEETMRLANERMRQQLETARIIQQSFLPGQLPGADDPRYSLAAANYPAASVGGDY
ncbi:MAG: PAS domain S-box protein, partial [Nitrospinae bacterium]|nr:PAS domain S-box protein [Nitrospinota bacterium]